MEASCWDITYYTLGSWQSSLQLVCAYMQDINSTQELVIDSNIHASMQLMHMPNSSTRLCTHVLNTSLSPLGLPRATDAPWRPVTTPLAGSAPTFLSLQLLSPPPHLHYTSRLFAVTVLPFAAAQLRWCGARSPWTSCPRDCSTLEALLVFSQARHAGGLQQSVPKASLPLFVFWDSCSLSFTRAASHSWSSGLRS